MGHIEVRQGICEVWVEEFLFGVEKEEDVREGNDLVFVGEPGGTGSRRSRLRVVLGEDPETEGKVNHGVRVRSSKEGTWCRRRRTVKGL